MALVEEGDLRPTAPRIAERAGVSVRSVFQHFDDLPALHTAVVERVVERLAMLVAPVDPEPAAGRAHRHVRRQPGGAARGGDAVPPGRGGARPVRPRAARGGGARAARTCARRSRRRSPPSSTGSCGAERASVLDALAAATSWGAWDGLRTDAGDTPEQAQAVVVRLVTAVLDSI